MKMMNENDEKRLFSIIKSTVEDNAVDYIFSRTRELLNKMPLPLPRVLHNLKKGPGVFIIYKTWKNRKQEDSFKLVSFGNYDSPENLEKILKLAVEGIPNSEKLCFAFIEAISDEMALIMEDILRKFKQKKKEKVRRALYAHPREKI